MLNMCVCANMLKEVKEVNTDRRKKKIAMNRQVACGKAKEAKLLDRIRMILKPT